MPRDLIFRVDVTMKGQPRHRSRAVKSAGGKIYARSYNQTTIKDKTGKRVPHPAAVAKFMIQETAKAFYREPVLEEPIQLDWMAVFPRPKSMQWKTKPMPRVWMTSKPDKDNCEKLIMDALNGIIWRDDAQVCCGSSCKVIASGNESPYVVIRVRTMEKFDAGKTSDPIPFAGPAK